MPGSSGTKTGDDSNKFTKLGFTDTYGSEEEIEDSSSESQVFKDLLAVQLVTMDTCINSLQLIAAKIPSDKKLTTTVQKLRATLNEYKIQGNLNSEPVSSPIPIISSTGERTQAKGEQNEELEQQTSSNIEQSEDGENANKIPMRTIGAEESESEETECSHSKTSLLTVGEIPLSSSSLDFVDIPSNYHYDPDTTTEEEKNMILDELKEHFSQFGEISNILINSHLDMTLFTDLKILGEKVERVKINLTTLDSAYYSFVLEQVWTKCHNLDFLDVGKQAKEETDEDENGKAKRLFALFLVKTISQLQSTNPRLKKNDAHRAGHESSPNFTISELLVDLQHFGQSNSTASVYKTFADSGVRVKDLTILQVCRISHRDFTLIKDTTRICQSSRDVLERWKYRCHSRPFLKEMEIPVLPNLHTLDISANFYDNNVLFHPDFRFSKQLPNLKTLRLELNGGGFVEKLWPSTSTGQGQGQGQGQSSCPGPAPSVKTFHFNDHGRVHDVEGVLNIFGQLEELSFPWRKNPNPSAIWKCKKLKNLTLFNVNLDSRESSINFLAQLLGFRVEDVEKLWKSKEAADSKTIKRIGPSILALQDLEILTLKPEPSWSAQEFKTKFLSLFWTLTSDFMPKLEEIHV